MRIIKDNKDPFWKRDKLFFFTGGCDSTYVLHNILSDKNFDNKKYNIRCIIIKSDQLLNSPIQIKAAKKILKKFKKEFEINIELVIVDIKNFTNLKNKSVLIHPALWASIAAFNVNENEDVVLGYNYNDGADVYPFIQDMDIAFNSLRNIIHLGAVNDCPKVYMYAPAMYDKKWEIIRYLCDNNLYKYCTWCEMPNEDGTPCNHCCCCESHNNYLAIKEFNCKKELAEEMVDEILEELE